ncbi:hypothetical protein GGG16DRAFT_100030 [Schizophyllum commune]
MKFSLIAAIAALLVVSFVTATPVRVFGAARNADATLTERSSEGMTNAQRMARGLPPMKPRNLSATRTVDRRQASQGAGGQRRRRDVDEPTRVDRRQTSQGAGGQRRSLPRMQKRDRYAGVYAQ